MNAAILLIDLQKYFYKLDHDKFDNKISRNIQWLLDFARNKKIRIIHIITIYKSDKSNWPESYKDREQMWCMETTEDAEIIQQALPEKGEEVIIKKRFSGFYETELEETLCKNKIDTLFLTGYSADVCVRLTTLDAFNRGYKLFWISDCIDSAFETYELSENYIKKLTRLNVITIDEMKKLFGQEI